MRGDGIETVGFIIMLFVVALLLVAWFNKPR